MFARASGVRRHEFIVGLAELRVAVALFGMFFLASPNLAYAAAKNADKSDDPADAVCDMDVGGSGTASKPLNSSNGSSSHRYLIGGICYDLSGNVQFTGQRTNAPEPHVGPGPTSNRTLTIDPDFRIESSKDTANGPFKTAFEVDWAYITDTGWNSTPTLDEATVAYIGFTVGYSDSLMNFWNSKDFQFTASAPDLSSYLVSYEYSFSDELKLAVAVEAGPPTSRGAATWQLPNAPPFVTTRLRYEKDNWALQASAAAHEIDVRAVPLLGIPSEKTTGWAATIGATVPLKLVAEDDAINLEVDYAVNSSIFLGTPADVSANAARFPVIRSDQGWSAVGSYQHNWSDKWASNAFVSYLALDVDLFLTKPFVRTTRYGVNLTYQPSDYWTIGVEIDAIDTQIEINGILGRVSGTSLKGETAYLWVKRNF